MSERKEKTGGQLADLRQDYDRDILHRRDLDSDPIAQLRLWLDQAIAEDAPEPTAMTLATADLEGKPSARIVLLKGLDADGLRFFTNYDSRKARDLAENPKAGLCFFWQPLHRQVRVEGRVERLTREDSAAYFTSRPRGSQFGAWASPQSDTIADRGQLEARLRDIEQRFADQDPLPLPDFWGGFLLRPTVFEFWQGRPSRLHDRFRYRLEDESWRIDRLAP